MRYSGEYERLRGEVKRLPAGNRPLQAWDRVGDVALLAPVSNDPPSEQAALAKGRAVDFLRSPEIAGGAANIRRNVIAKRGPNLRRERAANTKK